MKVEQSSQIVNDLYNQLIGNSEVETVDNTNIVDIGRELKDFDNKGDNVLNRIADKVGRMVILNQAVDVDENDIFSLITVDGWDWGSIMERLRVRPFEAENDPMWNPVSGEKYDSFNTYKAPDFVATYYEKGNAYKMRYFQVTTIMWSSFKSVEDFNKFASAIELAFKFSLDERKKALGRDALCNMIAVTLHDAFPDTKTENYGANSYTRAVNLIYEYNQEHQDAPVTVANCENNKEYLRFRANRLMNDIDRIKEPSKVFNIAGEVEFCKTENEMLVIRADALNKMRTQLYSDIFGPEYLDLGIKIHKITHWQGIGEANSSAWDKNQISSIDVTIEDKKNDNAKVNVKASNIFGILFDKRAVGINNEIRKMTSQYNSDLDAVCTQAHAFSQYYNDLSINFIVYYEADNIV